MNWYIHNMAEGSYGPYLTLREVKQELGMRLRRIGKERHVAESRYVTHGAEFVRSYYVLTYPTSIADGWFEQGNMQQLADAQAERDRRRGVGVDNLDYLV